MTTAYKEETYHPPLQVPNIGVHMYPALQLMEAKILQMKFHFVAGQQLTMKTLKTTCLKNLCVCGSLDVVSYNSQNPIF